MEHDIAWLTKVIISFTAVYIMRGSRRVSHWLA
jgi:hypothetical protein